MSLPDLTLLSTAAGRAIAGYIPYWQTSEVCPTADSAIDPD